jgi:hypothetical protein
MVWIATLCSFGYGEDLWSAQGHPQAFGSAPDDLAGRFIRSGSSKADRNRVEPVQYRI